MHTKSPMADLKYLYMSRTQRHIKSNTITINEVSNAIIKRPTNATFVSKETMEINAETESIRQASKNVYAESTLAKSKETERSTETKSSYETLQNETIGFAS